MTRAISIYPKTCRQSECDQLERIIDVHGVECVLIALSGICGGKAESIASNWQDTLLAKQWATLEGAIGVIVPKAAGL